MHVGRAVVTGVGGFIGSTLSRRLLAEGVEVVGVDAFTETYSPLVKRAAAGSLAASRGFDLLEADLADPGCTANLDRALDGADVVFHLAGRPGVRDSWGAPFERYLRDNVLGTQALLEACRHHTGSVRRIVVASSSSVYGDTPRGRGRLGEGAPLAPVSPYGVTKLAAEQLACAYARSVGLPVTCLRLFTVYGPGQRPDMLVHRLLAAVDLGRPFELLGDGTQERDMTFVDDAVDALIRAAGAVTLPPGTVVNVGGGSSVRVADVIAGVEATTGAAVPLLRRSAAPGDPMRTAAAIERAGSLLGWAPTTSLADGLAAQAAWQLGRALVG